MSRRLHTGITLCFWGSSKARCSWFSSESLAKTIEFCKADSGEKAQEIVGTVWICILSIQGQFLGAQAEPNTRNVPDLNSRPLLSSLQPQPHHIRFLSTPEHWVVRYLGSFSCQAQVLSSLYSKNTSQTPRKHLHLLFFNLKKTQTCFDFRWGCAFVLAAGLFGHH